jgi:hypothetical protein
MREHRTLTDRFVELVDQRIVPTLEVLGFDRQRAVLERDGGDVRWLVELELAPWTSPDKICFTLSWGVAVPGLESVFGDGDVTPERPAHCPISARLGEMATRLEATWFTVAPVRVPGLERVADARTAHAALRMIDLELLPALGQFDSIPAVQAHLVDNLVRGRGAAADGELRSIRWIAGLSLLLGERENASRWLDYLEARSSASIAPDVVSERVALLRQRCAS